METFEFKTEVEKIRQTINDCRNRGVTKLVVATRFKEMVVQHFGFGVALNNPAVEFRLI